MTIPTLTVESVSAALDKIIEANGEDHTYEAENGVCYYSTPEGKPGCIVGQVIALLDPEAFQFLVKIEYETTRSLWRDQRISAGGIDELVNDEHIVNVENVHLLMALADAQQAQDRGETWGQARRRFHEAINGAPWRP
jgi:hypothetical protein